MAAPRFQGINPTDGKPVNVNNLSVLAYYSLSKGESELAYSYVPIYCLTGVTITFSTNTKWITDQLGKTFSETMSRLGGVFNGKLGSGGYSWLLEALPKILLQIVYNEEDDEFPCEIQILFDKNASSFLGLNVWLF